MIFGQYKRGVSPVVATLLLITFAIALGTLVMSWGEQYASRTKNEDISGCAATKLSFIKIQNVDKICYRELDTGYAIETIMENRGKQDIENLKILYIDKNDNARSLIIEGIGGYDVQKADYTFNGMEQPNMVIFTPMIYDKGADVNCTQQRLIITDMEECR